MSVVSPGGSIGIYDLKNQLSAVLEEVMEGKEVTVTKHGRPIARIAPIAAADREDRAAAVAAIRELGERVRRLPADATGRELIDDGRAR